MHADLEGALIQLNKSWKCFTHNGQKMTKNEVYTVLTYGINKGYKTTKDFEDGEIDKVLKK